MPSTKRELPPYLWEAALRQRSGVMTGSGTVNSRLRLGVAPGTAMNDAAALNLWKAFRKSSLSPEFVTPNELVDTGTLLVVTPMLRLTLKYCNRQTVAQIRELWMIRRIVFKRLV